MSTHVREECSPPASLTYRTMHLPLEQKFRGRIQENYSKAGRFVVDRDSDVFSSATFTLPFLAVRVRVGRGGDQLSGRRRDGASRQATGGGAAEGRAHSRVD